MSITAETDVHAGFAPGTHWTSIQRLSTVTEVQAYILRECPGTNKRFAERSARTLVKYRDDIGTFFECLRILGMTNDPTPRKAVRNIERTTH